MTKALIHVFFLNLFFILILLDEKINKGYDSFVDEKIKQALQFIFSQSWQSKRLPAKQIF
ncbi:hypothetical protein NIES593_14700 [Hydrococcus rivularis NIES-593]|uniref:Uncharacterized protein n=1 Tax=Hydrococcus rivularis NIES-593 TaxID=1921803 RepID=A0A1U7HDR1_9CYAN|nr:hypothetical protein NIES593_14700 [Hydrococcus rivularis NIES-593]